MRWESADRKLTIASDEMYVQLGTRSRQRLTRRSAVKSSFHIPGNAMDLKEHDRKLGAEPPKKSSGNATAASASSDDLIPRWVSAGNGSCITSAILLKRKLEYLEWLFNSI